MISAKLILVRGIVQGVGFRPFVFRLAREHGLAGWVVNEESGARLLIEGATAALPSFLQALRTQAPDAARIASVEIRECQAEGLREFTIRESVRSGSSISARVSPDLPVCPDCLRELLDPQDRRGGYPYINCTNCGPRYSVVERLPYDRANTTMKAWPLDDFCAVEYGDPANRRFHAQPVACPACGPHYHLVEVEAAGMITGDRESVQGAAHLLRSGAIVAVKGIGGYHLACDASQALAVTALRERKFRKEQPFALMVPDVARARHLVELSPAAEKLMTSTARPIVLAPAWREWPEVAPGMNELGILLPYAPLHHLLFAAGAPEVLVMTSANRSSEPIAYRDEEALERLTGIADAWLIGERPITRRVDDSVARAGVFGPALLRRSRGYAPGMVAELPTAQPVLAVGADLKNTVTLVVGGQAFVSQHLGDLGEYESAQAFSQTIHDLLAMYEVDAAELTVVHDAHPEYASTRLARSLPARRYRAVQHHRAHIASVIAERGEWSREVVGITFDGTGYGDDGTIWGGELFTGGVQDGFVRRIHLRPAWLPGGDAAARHPVQCAAGYLWGIEVPIDLTAEPFCFPARYTQARQLVAKQVRTFRTTSMGRLFDTVAALLGYTRDTTYEGQAAIWLEQVGQRCRSQVMAYEFPIVNGVWDYEPLLTSVIRDRWRGRDAGEIARAVHAGIAQGIVAAADLFAHEANVLVLSGGVFQNQLLLQEVQARADHHRWEIWTNAAVPANDGGISLGQAALSSFG